MKYERLTNRGEPFYGFEKCKTCEYGKDGCDNWCDQITGCFCRLQEIEDKIESGELVNITELMVAETTRDLTEKEIEFFIKHNEEVRKDTAREILQMLIGHEMRDKGAHMAWVIVKQDVAFIAEKYGIELFGKTEQVGNSDKLEDEK